LNGSAQIQELVQHHDGAVYRLSVMLGHNQENNERNIMEFWKKEFLNSNNLDVFRDPKCDNYLF
jgi:hypothetical protein